MLEENRSEVARLLSQINAEYEAASLGLNGTAQVTRHDFISARDRNIDACRKQLIPLVGEKKATQLVAHTIWPETALPLSEQQDLEALGALPDNALKEEEGKSSALPVKNAERAS